MLFDVNSLATNTVAAIEYYRGAANIPVKFNVTGGGESCGLIVIWTNEKLVSRSGTARP